MWNLPSNKIEREYSDQVCFLKSNQVALQDGDGLNFVAPLLRFLPGLNDEPSTPSTDDQIRQDDSEPGKPPSVGLCPPGYRSYCCPDEGKPSERPPYTPETPPKWPKKPYPPVKPSQFQDYQGCARCKRPKKHSNWWPIRFLIVFTDFFNVPNPDCLKGIRCCTQFYVTVILLFLSRYHFFATSRGIFKLTLWNGKSPGKPDTDNSRQNRGNAYVCISSDRPLAPKPQKRSMGR